MVQPRDMSQIRAAVAGTDASMPRAEAMQLLLAADVPDKHRDFANVLQSPIEDVQLRSLAAAHLARMKSEAAVQALVNALTVPHPTIATVVLRGLGRLGSPEALPAIEAAATRSDSGAVVRQARFAATLIAYRFNLPLWDATLPPETEFVPLLTETADLLPIGIAAGTAAEVETAVASVSQEPVGIPLSPRAGWKIACQGFDWMLLLNEEFAGQTGLAELAERKAVPAIVALQSRENGEYRPALSVLTSSGLAPNTIDILVYNLSGRLVYAGPGTTVQGRVQLALRSVREGTVLPVSVAGTFDGRSFAVERAIIAASVRLERRTPRPLTMGEETSLVQ